MPTLPAWNLGALGKQAAELEESYQRLGSTLRLRPRLLKQEEQHRVILPRHLLRASSQSCVTIATLAMPNLSYLLVFDGKEKQPARRAWPVPSAAGVAEVTRCGARKALLRDLSVKLRSRRGAVEFIVVESEHPPPPISELLPSRNPGPSLASPQVGRRPWLAPLKTRLEALERRSKREGAYRIVHSALSADETGRGSSVVHLGPGCHRLEVLADTHAESPPDLDGRLFTLTQGTQVAEDNEHRGQVRLEHCVGRPERIRLDYSGAKPLSELTLVQSSWELPSGFPLGWGPFSRARLAEAAWKRGLGVYSDSPTSSSLGVRGVTGLVTELAPNACYSAVVAPIRGDVYSMAVGVSVGSSAHEAHALEGQGVSLTFCANGAQRAHLEVQALGQGVAWIMGLWRIGGEP